MSSRLPAIALGLAALVLGSTAAVSSAASDEAGSRPERAKDFTTPGPVDSVLAISIDGLNPTALRKLGRDGTPALHQLMKQGASTLNARTEYEQTVTLPNHTGMVTGRRIDAATGGHGVTWNDDRMVPSTVQAAAGSPVTSVFNVIHEAGGSTALFAGKTKFSLWQRSWPDAIDRTDILASNGALADDVIADLRDQSRAFRFLHLSLPDLVGHARGFMSPAYLKAVQRTDRVVGRVLRAAKDVPLLRGHLAVVLTADHGGRGPGHEDATKLYDYKVPFMVRGPGVDRGSSLYALNPDYAEPGRSRPTYVADRQPVRNGDVANLSLDLLGLPAVPGSEHDAGQDLDVTASPAG
jgi:hypothetical protein